MTPNLKLLIISAPFDRLRRDSAIKYAQTTRLPYEVLEGINGDTLDPRSLPLAGAGYSFSPRILACYLSHIRALTIAASTRERCVILEDDWMPTGDILTSVERMPSEGDYTLLHGINWDGAPGVVQFAAETWERMSPPPIVALAYIPGPAFIEAALRHAFPITDHVDHHYRNICIRYQLKCYRAKPAPVTGAGFKSTLGHS